ncbi:FAD-dependent oxidoreductase [Burkholderiaceae bacterium FT117]|uniref:FAD-dependent oxidoreductase n=1 Tax=Zeimonas sediminis TaxID=2944268 RepID=UPI002342F39C|nr:FAD-dependent oxidoreductase [Zeimonas sediminis]MCM5571589.1 FAD-dependent oxidoreductase [Zeimonas sediminis]
MSTETFDIVVIGAGAAGMTAAAVAAAEGRRVLLVEHARQVGGTTAISGGMVWVPANPIMTEAGMPDSLDEARAYLRSTMPPLDDTRTLEAFLERGPEAIRYLEAKTSVRLQPVKTYPDYYPDQPGATAGGRVLEPVPFDASELGPAFALLRPPLPEFMLFGGMMISRSDIPHLRRMGRSAASAWHVAKLVGRYALQRLRAPRGTTLYLGNALAARLLKSVRELGVELRIGTSVTRLLTSEGGVTGVEIEHGGRRDQVRARAVILACGGISHDASLRPRYMPAGIDALSATVRSGAASSGAALAQAAGARLSAAAGARQGFWVPASTFSRPDGSPAVFPHTVTDRGKPGVIAVDKRGRRFVNEAVSYHEFVLRQLKAGPDALPAWLVCDRRFLWKYGLGSVKPFSLSTWGAVRSGYLKRAGTLAELAREIGVPPDALEETVQGFNADAREGLDTEFGRGSDIYQRHLGDGDRRPNPCVAPIEQAPFYAVAVRPADLGMAAGVVADASARALAADGTPIPGLYVCGNDMESVMNGAYPGPGITLGPALVFGYVAGRHAAAPG